MKLITKYVNSPFYMMHKTKNEILCKELLSFWKKNVLNHKNKKIWLTVIINISNKHDLVIINNLPFNTSDYEDVFIVIGEVLANSNNMLLARADYINYITFSYHFTTSMKTNLFYRLSLAKLVIILILFLLTLPLFLQFLYLINTDNLNYFNLYSVKFFLDYCGYCSEIITDFSHNTINLLTKVQVFYKGLCLDSALYETQIQKALNSANMKQNFEVVENFQKIPVALDKDKGRCIFTLFIDLFSLNESSYTYYPSNFLPIYELNVGTKEQEKEIFHLCLEQWREHIFHIQYKMVDDLTRLAYEQSRELYQILSKYQEISLDTY